MASLSPAPLNAGSHAVSEAHTASVLRSQVKEQARRGRAGGLETSLIDILPVEFDSAAFVCWDNGSYRRVRAVFGPIIALRGRLGGFLPACPRHRSGGADLIEDPALGRALRDAPFLPMLLSALPCVGEA